MGLLHFKKARHIAGVILRGEPVGVQTTPSRLGALKLTINWRSC